MPSTYFASEQYFAFAESTTSSRVMPCPRRMMYAVSSSFPGSARVVISGAGGSFLTTSLPSSGSSSSSRRNSFLSAAVWYHTVSASTRSPIAVKDALELVARSTTASVYRPATSSAVESALSKSNASTFAMHVLRKSTMRGRCAGGAASFTAASPARSRATSFSSTCFLRAASSSTRRASSSFVRSSSCRTCSSSTVRCCSMTSRSRSTRCSFRPFAILFRCSAYALSCLNTWPAGWCRTRCSASQRCGLTFWDDPALACSAPRASILYPAGGGTTPCASRCSERWTSAGRSVGKMVSCRNA
mmetsp:Transcript_45337/g.108107  ORF Transcript_45337/g.108107 Transcript_45337/m.108107 type:complete len:302 (-) Transcript_45337:225-1130(-)